MPAALPKELRERFARLIEEGLSGREASRRLQVSAATGARWRRQILASGAAPKGVRVLSLQSLRSV